MLYLLIKVWDYFASIFWHLRLVTKNLSIPTIATKKLPSSGVKEVKIKTVSSRSFLGKRLTISF